MNPHEAAARTRKVLAILSVVPCGRDAEEIGKVAAWLRDLPQADRDALAASAGAKSPSQITWDEVVRAAGQRRSVAEMFPVTHPPKPPMRPTPPKLTVLQGGKAA